MWELTVWYPDLKCNAKQYLDLNYNFCDIFTNLVVLSGLNVIFLFLFLPWNIYCTSLRTLSLVHIINLQSDFSLLWEGLLCYDSDWCSFATVFIYSCQFIIVCMHEYIMHSVSVCVCVCVCVHTHACIHVWVCVRERVVNKKPKKCQHCVQFLSFYSVIVLFLFLILLKCILSMCSYIKPVMSWTVIVNSISSWGGKFGWQDGKIQWLNWQCIPTVCC